MPWIILNGHVPLHELPEPYPLILCHHLDTNSSDTTNENSHPLAPAKTLAEKARGEIGEIIAPISPHVPFFGLNKVVIYVALI